MALGYKQRRFVEEYLVDLNATAAAKRAGYTDSGAFQQGYRLLKNVEVAEAIAKAQERLAKKFEVKAERIIEELAKIGFANMQDYMIVGANGDPVLNWAALTRDQAAALVEVTVDTYTEGKGDDAERVKRVKFKLADKRAALVDLGKHLGLFEEKSRIDVNVTHQHINVVDVIMNEIEAVRTKSLPQN